MSQETNIRQLVINKLTDAQYEQAVKNADELYLTPDTGGGGGGSGTVTSVRVQATSPVVSSQSTEQTTTLNTTISLANNYGDTKNPYASKAANYVLAAPNGSAGTPSFRALVKADIPLASETAASGGTTTSLVTTGEKYTWNSKQDALTAQTAYTSKGSATKVPQITTNTLGQVTGITEVDITLTKSDVGLSNVDNTSDLDKPISTATQTALDAKQNTISDLGYIRNQVAKVDDKISAIDITDSGDSLPSAANYSVGDTFLNKTDKKLYTVEAPAYALDSGVSNNNVDINLTTGLATFDNSSDILSRSTTFEWSGTGVVINVHFKLNSISQGVIISNSCSKYGGQSRHSLDVNLITTSDSNYLCFEYWAYGSGSKTYIFNYQLFDTVLQTNTDYYLYMVKNGDTCISTLSLNGYNNNIIETSEIPTQDVTGFQGWTPELKYGCNSWIYSSSNPGMSVYLLDSIGNFLVADGALTWNAGTTLIDNTQYNDTTNEKTIYYNNNILYEDGSGLPDQSGQSGKYLTTDGTTASWATVQAGPKFLSFTNVSASSWVVDNTYQDYGYKCELTCNGVTSSDYAQVIFGPTQATNGNYANLCLTGTDSVTIYSKVNTAITIPTIFIIGSN